ncbi:MAG: DUF4249 domain-containing protein [Prevotellaceae bacterium]|jgi:hypothetical protein|nr:DUF4249 domain-containing protein [Prevotellaceae bacterium]
MRKYLSLTLILASLLSCVEPFDIKTDNSPPVIVIYGYLTDEPGYHAIKVSASSPYFDTAPNRGISGATVKISSDNTLISFHEVDTVPGLYVTVSRTAGIPGRTYSLSVETDFDSDGIRETYTATSTMLSAVEVDSVTIQEMSLMGNRFYTLNLYAQDAPGEDYYLGRYRLNDSIILASIDRLSPMSDATLDGQYINGLMIRGFSDERDREKIENRDDGENRNPRVYLSPGDTITFSLCRIEKGYYEFINQCQQEMNGENPFFGGPASNITTNISGGGIGYFTTYAFSTVKTVVPE